jgi:phage minor structural protein
LSNKNTVLNTNGLAVLDPICLNARITEKMNGEYGLNATFIIDQEHNRHEYIEQEAIIKCDDIYGDEVFRIAKLTKTLNGRIEIYARHITYDTNDMWLEDVRPTLQNGYHFLDWLFTHTTNPNSDFTYNSNITSEGTSYFINKSIYNAIFDADNSFLNTFGGEVERRQYNITINNQICYDNGVSIRSRKNLTGFEAYTDIDTVITRIYPKGNNGITIDNKYIDSPYINNYSKIKSAEIQFNIGVDEENGITEAMAKQRLLEEAQKKFSVDKIDILKAEYKINFVELSKTEEYKDYAVLEKINLGDFVNVYEENFDINIKVRAVERYWNVLRQEHTSITLSNYAIQSNIATINKVINTINQFKDPQSGFLSQAYEQMKAGLSNSYVVCKQNEILAMNTKDKATATEGLQLTKDGLLGYSNGFNNPPNVAIMIDGTINGNMIKTGVIQSLDGTFRLDLGGGSLTTYDYSGRKAIKMVNQVIQFFDFKNDSNSEVGRIASVYDTSDASKSGIVIEAPSGRYVGINKQLTDTSSERYVQFDMGAFGNTYPINFYKDVAAKGDFRQKINDGYYYPVNIIQTGTTVLNTGQEARINLTSALTGCGFKTLQLGVTQTYKNNCTGLNEFYTDESYIDEGNNQLVLRGGVQHFTINSDDSVSFMTDGTLTIKWAVFGCKA